MCVCHSEDRAMERTAGAEVDDGEGCADFAINRGKRTKPCPSFHPSVDRKR